MEVEAISGTRVFLRTCFAMALGLPACGSDGTAGQPATPTPLINGIQWADTSGKPIQAHGGGVLKVGAYYYWFGENRNPDDTFHAVSCYRSADLRNWEFRSDVLTMSSDPDLNPANIERPKVAYNAATDNYVMWMHWENGSDYSEARAAVAVSKSVDGPYTYRGSFRPLADSGVIDHGKPVGVITRGDVATALAHAGPEATVANAPQLLVVTVSPAVSLDAVLDRLRQEPDAVALVVDHGLPVGVLTAEHLAAYVALHGQRRAA